MLKRNNRKGFTLAELLIVVAIIAVLVAIAVPIFVGALERAEKATIEANERTMKGLVVAEILDDDNLLYYTKTESEGKTTREHCTEWYAKGEYDASSDQWTISKANIVSKESGGDTSEVTGTSSKSGNKYTLYITIHYVDVVA